jgi:hypothetical protein
MVNSISAFEYVTILISIILGLGITQILSSLAEILYDYRQVKFFWVHTIWVILILYIHIQEWFVLYELKDYSSWKLPVFLFVLLYPITLYLAAKMLFPVIDKGQMIDLKSFFLINYRPLYLLLLICILLSLIFNTWLLNIDFEKQYFLAILFVTTSVLLFRRKLTIQAHGVFAVILLIFAVASILLEQNNWVVK